MPTYAVKKVKKMLKLNKKKIKGSKILLLGASYKKDSSDTRETPSIKREASRRNSRTARR